MCRGRRRNTLHLPLRYVSLSVWVFPCLKFLAARYCDIVKESNHIPGDQRASGHGRTRLGDKVAELGVKRTMYYDRSEMENCTSVTWWET